MVYVLRSGLQNDGECEPTDVKDRQTKKVFWIASIGETGKSQSSQVPSFGPTKTLGEDISVMTAWYLVSFSGLEAEIFRGTTGMSVRTLVDVPTTREMDAKRTARAS